jgi:solute carrier family 25 (adenine nucleotide translocator) protein 4/5/6/31
VGEFLSFIVGKAALKTAMAPLVRVKLLLQTQAAAPYIPKQSGFKGTLDCFRRVFKEQGVFSFWFVLPSLN